MDKRTRYDVNFKITLANEYATGRVTYGELSKKYDVPRSTIAKWIQKYKKHKADPLLMRESQEPYFLDVTNALQATKEVPAAMTIVVNGLELKSDLNTLIRLLQGAKHV
ncbi:MAG: transposase [Bacilli bacterium]|nr:transposase [Bacilli bacterium]